MKGFPTVVIVKHIRDHVGDEERKTDGNFVEKLEIEWTIPRRTTRALWIQVESVAPNVAVQRKYDDAQGAKWWVLAHQVAESFTLFSVSCHDVGEKNSGVCRSFDCRRKFEIADPVRGY